MSEYDELLAQMDRNDDFVMSNLSAARAIRAQAKRIADLESWGQKQALDIASLGPLAARTVIAESRLAAIDAYRGEAEKVASAIMNEWCFSCNNSEPLTGAISYALLAARMEGAEAERKACAEIADEFVRDPIVERSDSQARIIAEEIRARKDTP